MPRRRFTSPAALAGSGALLALLLPAAPAFAGDFAPDGTFAFDPRAVATLDFEEVDAGAGAAADEGALAGGHVLALAQYASSEVAIEVPKVRATYRASAWIRDGEVTATLDVYYGDRQSEVVALYPTGRITSDGWIEVANDHVRLDGARLQRLGFGFFTAAAKAAVDAAELVPDGGPEAFPTIANAACDGASDSASCASDQVCIFSECRNVAGWVPPIPADRDAVADYLAARIHLIFGPYLERSVDMPAVDVLLGEMRLAQDRWSYWSAFMAAVRRLHDGHTSTNGINDYVLGQGPRPLTACFLEGDADLSHGIAPKDPEYLDVLVSHTGADHNLGLQPGDRLVAVDGQHPIAWARSLAGVNWSQPGISNHETFAELASSLRGSIQRFAGTLSVIRCDPQKGTCGAVETIAIKDIPADPPGTKVDRVLCDNRPLRHVPGAPANHGMGEQVHVGLVDPASSIYGMEWESLYTTDGSDGVGAALDAAVASFRADARGVILDHRTGNGGTTLAAQQLWSFAVPRYPSDLYVDRTFAEEEQPAASDAQGRFQAALSGPLMLYAGSANPVTDVPVALLVTQDVSASDWLAEGMKHGAKAKVFGPFQTNGAFSTRYMFGYWLSMGFVLAVGDDILADGTTHNGRGVEPDVVVLPKQSDLLAGKDTVYEAALAWVRSELKP